MAAAGLPVLWLFTDPDRLADACQVAARLPVGLCGVVLRYAARAQSPAERAGRLAAARELSAVCRARRIALHVAGDGWVAQALQAGLHLRRGRRVPGMRRVGGRITSSAHGLVELVRARRAGAALAFLSPCFATRSHPGTIALGARRWSLLARQGGLPSLALGGIDGVRVRAVARDVCAGVGAIGALSG